MTDVGARWAAKVGDLGAKHVRWAVTVDGRLVGGALTGAGVVALEAEWPEGRWEESMDGCPWYATGERCERIGIVRRVERELSTGLPVVRCPDHPDDGDWSVAPGGRVRLFCRVVGCRWESADPLPAGDPRLRG